MKVFLKVISHASIICTLPLYLLATIGAFCWLCITSCKHGWGFDAVIDGMKEAFEGFKEAYQTTMKMIDEMDF